MGRYEALKVSRYPEKVMDFLSTGKVRIFNIVAWQDFRVSHFDFSDEGGIIFDVEQTDEGKYRLTSYGYGVTSEDPRYDDKSYGNGTLHLIDAWVIEAKFEAVK